MSACFDALSDTISDEVVESIVSHRLSLSLSLFDLPSIADRHVCARGWCPVAQNGSCARVLLHCADPCYSAHTHTNKPRVHAHFPCVISPRRPPPPPHTRTQGPDAEMDPVSPGRLPNSVISEKTRKGGRKLTGQQDVIVATCWSFILSMFYIMAIETEDWDVFLR
jgi:hypothetical protein